MEISNLWSDLPSGERLGAGISNGNERSRGSLPRSRPLRTLLRESLLVRFQEVVELIKDSRMHPNQNAFIELEDLALSKIKISAIDRMIHSLSDSPFRSTLIAARKRKTEIEASLSLKSTSELMSMTDMNRRGELPPQRVLLLFVSYVNAKRVQSNIVVSIVVLPSSRTTQRGASSNDVVRSRVPCLHRDSIQHFLPELISQHGRNRRRSFSLVERNHVSQPTASVPQGPVGARLARFSLAA